MMMPSRLTEISDLERKDHHYLPASAKCYFWGEYTPYEHTQGKKWDYSPTNRLISNFKKKMDRSGRPDGHYKAEAIRQVAEQFSKSWRWDQLHERYRICLVPIPPSKSRRDPMYDPRMRDALNLLASLVGLPLDIRDCLTFSGAYAASHETDDRPGPDDLYHDLDFDGEVGRPEQVPGLIFLFDDMITTGAHYVAAARKLAELFPGTDIIGNFIARRCFPNPFEDFGIIF